VGLHRAWGKQTQAPAASRKLKRGGKIMVSSDRRLGTGIERQRKGGRAFFCNFAGVGAPEERVPRRLQISDDASPSPTERCAHRASGEGGE